MKFTPVTSSNLDGVHYDATSKTLTVKFKNGATYHYHQVTPDHYEGLISAKSPGSYMHSHIKGGGYKYAKS